MKKLSIKLLISFILSVFVCLPVFSTDAKVTYVKGKVEVSRNGEWVSLKVGDIVSKSETINTGFQSEARLNINGSVMAVPALTRVTIETISSTSKKDTVSLYVDTGAVRSKVTHTDNKKIDYTARTAVAVASVRGTDFTITAKGKVTCIEGAVAVYSAKKWQEMQNALDETIEEEEEVESEEGMISELDETEEEEESDETGDGNEDTSDSEDGSDLSSESNEVLTDSGTDGSDSETMGSDNPTTDNSTSDTASEERKVADNSKGDNTEGSANATTPANNISSNVPDGAVVVGAGQTTSFTTIGNPDKPKTETEEKSDKLKNQVNTQAEKDAASDGTKTETVSNETSKPRRGSLKINIVLKDE